MKIVMYVTNLALLIELNCVIIFSQIINHDLGGYVLKVLIYFHNFHKIWLEDKPQEI